MRSHASLFVALLACAALEGAARAQSDYPSRPIRYIVASAPGGIADITPRVLAPHLSQALRQPVVVENRPGGGIVAGGETVAKSAPDGYTLLSATPQVAIVQSMVKDLAFDPRRDLAPVALVGVIPNVLVAGPRTPAKTLAELLELARRNPGKMNYSSTGAGTSVHLSAELLKYYAGVDIVHVPYRGAAAAMTALLAGDVDIMVDSVPPSLPHIRAGRVRALAVTSARRVPQLPEVPTMIESGYPDFAGRNHRAPRSGNQALARAVAGRRGLRKRGPHGALHGRGRVRQILGRGDREVRARDQALRSGEGVIRGGTG